MADHLVPKDAVPLLNSLHLKDDCMANGPLQQKKIVLGQMKVPVYQKQHFWSPDFVKCEGKIIKYNLRTFGVWKVSHIKHRCALLTSN